MNQMYKLIARYDVPTPPEDLAVFQVAISRSHFSDDFAKF